MTSVSDDLTFDECGKTYSRNTSVIHHKETIHKKNVAAVADNKRKYECRVCKKFFTVLTNRRRHEKKIHKFTPVNKTLKRCSECHETFHSCKDIMNHFERTHSDIKINTEEKEFDTVNDFKLWKLEMERTSLSFYVRLYTYKTTEYFFEKFFCHRSGSPVIKTTGKRHLKSRGYYKSGYFCPASIIARILEGGKVTVEFTSTHIGHQCDVNYLRLSKPEKSEIAGLMYTGVPLRMIRKKITENPSASKRLVATKLQDLRNVAISYGMGTRLTPLQRGKLTKKISTIRSKCKIAEQKYMKNPINQESDDSLGKDFSIDCQDDWIESEEEVVIHEIQKTHQGNEDTEALRRKTISTILGLIPDIENFSSEQCKEMLKSINMAKNKCQSI